MSTQRGLEWASRPRGADGNRMFVSGALRRAVPLLAVLSCLFAAAPAAAETLRAAPSRSFIDSVGVNVHPTYVDTPYRDGDRVVAMLQNLGLHHVRHGIDAAQEPNLQWVNTRVEAFVRKLASKQITVNFLAGDPNGRSGTIPRQLKQLREHLLVGAESIEGPNEWDFKGGANWAATLRTYQRELYSAVKADPALRKLPVIAPSLGNWRSLPTLGDLSAYADRGNLHAYSGGKPPGQSWLDLQLTAQKRVTASKPVALTETGYHNALAYAGPHRPVPESVAATYIPRMYLEHYRRGIVRSFAYELIDEKPDAAGTDMERHFGLLRRDWSLKPAAIALRNLLSVAGGASYSAPARAGSIDLSLAGAAAGARRVALRRADGSVVVFLWQDASVYDRDTARRLAPPALSGTLGVAQRFTRVEQYRIGQSANPTSRQGFSGKVQVSIPSGDIVAIRLSGATGRTSRRPARSRRHVRRATSRR